MKPKHFLSISDFDKKEFMTVLNIALRLKKELKTTGSNKKLLFGKSMAMIFEKPSLRTRLSFEIGMTQLGGHAIYLAPSDIGLGVREKISDVARVTSSMADIIIARVFRHESVEELSKYSRVPVINVLSDLEHPCQILADLLTIIEIKKSFSGIKLAFVGDGENNVTHSLALACAMLGIRFSVASPRGFKMNKLIVKKAKKIAVNTGASLIETNNPIDVVQNADVVYTDTWVSMGDESEKEKRLKIFRDYQVTISLMKKTKPNAIFMHDMPAYRGLEVSAEVIDGPQSVIFQQAENRLHAQKALLVYLLNS
ncbi:ornithine carbamoyltransferase [Candidatus Roizmanbacteria bacterium RIFCSPLOWO2_01_FULL_38_12]|uniref:Ornithine carbamoyltransferase n=1 Tax=Candidatus Roizmanbacteria bacterium RIFCSPLOWO2_01_FULL_38_12 TaxID=1802061 RepID=A0A1F7IY62_9BACT|nr:MAG: ornithine carbamoyltransferase [Candidatus Roizmanbacteria bacterium RIFCSPHIGHO2_01_FULL_38_15]OGK34478.1 MAG: ornithine carbamoyltransferase [Candidatus Roizmanbacteria bacterium RIFCSPHIGHO2_12_FULL_38_13]OGK48308.1 MAG: ornithine carbamoyltransferase [Candidatus Roizmanbacteria bacterium RIFCSPLOWO2_01_FULL_38_12]